ncbi:hypothetical protein [Devosia sp. SD17-2]|uniref:hypothetical protein n=1 Tax=Devosia sp. SD17-2 TaxID=2976459 RepID=UPI0023D89947|nr:hypothetical protein [Devosia sp. SD17-2]WEJ32822.1 hypothetical protein NYQ88_18400 [Devosia sp. SD17-2]
MGAVRLFMHLSAFIFLLSGSAVNAQVLAPLQLLSEIDAEGFFVPGSDTENIPASNLASLVDDLGFANGFAPSLIGFAINREATNSLNDFCSALDENWNSLLRRHVYDAVLNEAVKLGVIPRTEVLGYTRGAQTELDAIAAGHAVLKQYADQARTIMDTHERDEALIGQIGEFCYRPSDIFTYQSWPGVNDLECDDHDVYSDEFARIAPFVPSSLFDFLLTQEVDQFELECAQIGLDLAYKEFASLSVKRSRIYRGDLRGAVGSRLEISGSVVYNGIDASSSAFSEARLVNSDFLHTIDFSEATISGSITLRNLDAEAENDARSVHMHGASVAGSLTIDSSKFVGEVYLGVTRLGALRIEDVDVVGLLNLWGAAVEGYTFIGQSGHSKFTGGLHAFYFSSEDLQISNVETTNITLTSSSIRGTSWFENIMSSGYISLRNARLFNIEVSDTAASSLWLKDAAVEGAVVLNDASFKVLHAGGMTARSFNVNSSNERPQLQPLVDCGITRSSDSYGQYACLDRADLSSVIIEGNASIGGFIRNQVNLSSSIIGGQLQIAGPTTNFADAGCVIAKDLQTDTLVINLDSSSTGTRVRGPVYVDLHGAEFRVLGNPTGSEVGGHRVGGVLAKFLAPLDARCDENGFVSGEASDARYQPLVYDALASGYERSGELDLARSIKVEKNRAYASALAWGDDWSSAFLPAVTKGFYYVADIVSGYGYENLKALVFLIILTAVGALLGWIGEAQLTRWRDYVLRKLRLSRLVNKPSRGRSSGGETIRGRRAPGFIFSIDRAVPNLNLDQDFARHQDMDVGPILSGWFYFQRFVSFLILALMVAGALQVFQ